MGKHSGSTDFTNRIVLTPLIVRAFWSARRAWHGAELKLHIETRHVPDGTKCTLQIWEDDSSENNPDDFVDEPKGSFVIDKNRCVVPYKLAWDEASLGDPLELEGDSLEFYFKVRIEKLGLEKRSDLLYVDLHKFAPST